MDDVLYYEILFKDGYGICIKGTEKPTHDEAAQFLSDDMKKWNYTISDIEAVFEIPHLEATYLYDLEREDEWPVFTRQEHKSEG